MCNVIVIIFGAVTSSRLHVTRFRGIQIQVTGYQLPVTGNTEIQVIRLGVFDMVLSFENQAL
jgi:hypothetical protein